MLVIEKYKLIFCHVSKNAGISIEKAFGFTHNIGHHHVRKIPDDQKNFTIFAVKRNPYSRIYSAYQYNKMMWETNQNRGIKLRSLMAEKNALNSFEKFLLEVLPHAGNHITVFPQKTWFNNRFFVVHEVLRFENLEEDFKNFKKKFNIEEEICLPHKNKSKKNSEKYRKLYTPDMKLMVDILYEWDVKNLGYEF